jgi:hypothetical protein
MYAPDRQRNALTRQRSTLSPRSAPEMKAARERPGLPACTAWSAKSPSSVRAGVPRRPKDSTDIGTKGRAEDTCRYARRLEASRAAAASPGAHAAPPAKEAAAGWMTETSPTTSWRENTPRREVFLRGGTPRGPGEREGTPGPGEEAGSAGSVDCTLVESCWSVFARTDSVRLSMKVLDLAVLPCCWRPPQHP